MCTATVPGLGPAQSHADTATVSAVDAVTQTRVSSSDAWNGHVPTHPAIDIEKWTTSEGPGPGDHDTRENAGVLGAGVATPLTFTISNPGDVRLFDVEVTDATHRGPAAQHLSCDFSPLGGPATGTTWAGPLLAGASFVCHATVPGLPDGGIHVDTAYVVAADDIEGEGTDVSDADAWSAAVPADHDPGDPDPGDPDPGDDGVADPDSGGGGALPDTGGVDAAVLVLGLLATIGGASMIGWRRLRS
jgi:hypothetical protein